jgi:hypothetical protein
MFLRPVSIPMSRDDLDELTDTLAAVRDDVVSAKHEEETRCNRLRSSKAINASYDRLDVFDARIATLDRMQALLDDVAKDV